MHNKTSTFLADSGETVLPYAVGSTIIVAIGAIMRRFGTSRLIILFVSRALLSLSIFLSNSVNPPPSSPDCDMARRSSSQQESARPIRPTVMSIDETNQSSLSTPRDLGSPSETDVGDYSPIRSRTSTAAQRRSLPILAPGGNGSERSLSRTPCVCGSLPSFPR